MSIKNFINKSLHFHCSFGFVLFCFVLLFGFRWEIHVGGKFFGDQVCAAAPQPSNTTTQNNNYKYITHNSQQPIHHTILPASKYKEVMKRGEFDLFLCKKRDFNNDGDFNAFVNFLRTSDTLTTEQKQEAVNNTKVLWWAVYKNAKLEVIEFLVDISSGEHIFWGVNCQRRNRSDTEDDGSMTSRNKRRRIHC